MANQDIDSEIAYLTALVVNEQRRLTGLPGFQVDIFKDDVYVDSQAVYAKDEYEAQTAAMMQTPADFRGETVTYKVRELE